MLTSDFNPTGPRCSFCHAATSSPGHAIAAGRRSCPTVPMLVPVFYWIDDEDEDEVARFIGQRVEVVGR